MTLDRLILGRVESTFLECWFYNKSKRVPDILIDEC